ncbi:phospho-N-acetylmuramoyl-pentapeptide-transferase [Nakamurella aerolata]|uniref:Phospho-N-acetylmuramoyl-pentapeptide-transferase n=1 Tax=Nakamurella aerolata TaxID=1656892 RepID=A0A849A922_9ACTN|nr:phospho-N-acetylmuramoyl-pentapeptide-transferase [Nakamurella aerolata]
MKNILIAAVVGLAVAITLTPYLIKVFSRIGFGQEIREDGPQSHKVKRGTPTMGGVAIITAMWAGYLATIVVNWIGGDGGGPTASAWLLLYLTTGLGLVGFLDDFIKIRKKRNLGLNKRAKLVGQLLIAISFGILALMFRSSHSGLTPASTHLSYTRDLAWLSFGTVGFVLFAVILISAWSNAVNFTDGLDGLAAGSSVMVLGSYVFVAFFQFRNSCVEGVLASGCYQVRDPLDIAVVAAAALGGCIGFLWWNAHPAKIFMGDTGSLALGGMVAGLSIFTKTELLMVAIGGLFVIEMISDIIQIVVYKTRKVRVFKMAPIHHHFDLAGWPETTVLVRFWLLAAMAAALGLGLFYADWLSVSGT